jgi:hypothetical protein
VLLPFGYLPGTGKQFLQMAVVGGSNTQFNLFHSHQRELANDLVALTLAEAHPWRLFAFPQGGVNDAVKV